jgi:hypothetical protein
MEEYYLKFDTKIRDLIYRLRNNGINTRAGSGDKGYVEAEWCNEFDAETVYKVCREAGYKWIRIEMIHATFPVLQKYIKIRLYDKKFSNIPQTYTPKIYTENQGYALTSHKEIIERLLLLFPKFIFISEFDPKISDEDLPRTVGKEMIYVLNYEPEIETQFLSAIEGEKETIEFCRLDKKATQEHIELFSKIGITI